MKTPRSALALAFAVALAACTTPPAAIQQAHQTVKLTQGLRTELLRFQRNMDLVAGRRDAAQSRDLESIAFVDKELAVLDGHRSVAGGDADRSAMEMEKRLRDAINSRRLAIDAETRARSDFAVAVASSGREAASAPARLVVVQKAMAELGAELSVAERLRIVTSFASDVKTLLDANGKAADAAAGRAAPVPMPAASAASAP